MKTPNEYRITEGFMASYNNDGNNGAFIIPYKSLRFQVICSDGMVWEHVSVSLLNRTPTWKEMCFIKDLFWDKDECVIQIHPSKEKYINNHNFCLHLF